MATKQEVKSYILQTRQAIERAAERGGEHFEARPHKYIEGEYLSREEAFSSALHYLLLAERHLEQEQDSSLVLLGAAIGLSYSQGLTFDLFDRFAELKNVRPANERPA